MNASLSKLVKFGKLPVSLQGGIGYWLQTPDTGPKGWRYRLQAAFVLPKMFKLWLKSIALIELFLMRIGAPRGGFLVQ
jgi:hypothetical protein